MIQLTPSKMRDYLQCGLRYKLQLEEHAPFMSTPATAFGTFLHKALEEIYKRPEHRGDLETLLHSVWDASEFNDFPDSDRHFGRGLVALERYCKAFFDTE